MVSKVAESAQILKEQYAKVRLVLVAQLTRWSIPPTPLKHGASFN